MKAPWTVLAVLSLVGISLFSIYVAGFTSQGIMCSYVTMMPYFLPISFALGLLFGYALPQIARKERDPQQVANLFEGDEKAVVLAAVGNKMQSEVSAKIGKVKAFRTIRRLENKGVVVKVAEKGSYRLAPGPRLKKLL